MPESDQNGNGAGSPASPKIRFNAPSSLGAGGGDGNGNGNGASDSSASETSSGGATVIGSSKIRTNERVRHEDVWNRTPNQNGTGAMHVRTFHSKLTDESLVYLDQSINEWLDSHPEYEVKLVTTSIGTFTGKTKEPALIVQVWV
ncbi:MAG: hypothetical protein ACF8PN_16320 [Phycisphaerales bacterium]